MSLWRNVRAEIAGAWRSVCYDLGRQLPARGAAGPDVTSTGMNTFPGTLAGLGLSAGTPEDDDRPPRRFVAVAAFCALAACGAAGSYLVATTTFAGRMTDAPAVAPPVAVASMPPVSEAGPPAKRNGHAGMGGTAHEPRAGAVAPPSPVVITTTRTVLATPPPTRENTHPAAPVASSPDCDCDTPPVPTPTAPAPSVPSFASPSGSPGPGTSVPAEPILGDGSWMPGGDSRLGRPPW
jgi:hypothetical protein